MQINHNIAALNTYRQLNTASTAQSKSMEKLSSGLRINGAADDAAGLAISEKMRGQIRGLDQAAKNAQDGISLIQTAEGALNETHSILQRQRELAVQASNGTATDDDRKEIQKEMNQLIDEIDRISTDTNFNTKNLLGGSLNEKIQIGANQNQSMNIQFNNMSSSAIGTKSGSGLVSTASIVTDFSSASSLDSEFTLDATVGGNALTQATITLDQDYGSVDEVVNAINNQIQGNADFKNLIQATVKADGKIGFENLTSDAVTITNGSGTVDIADALKITPAAVGGTTTSVNSLKQDTDTASSGGVLTQSDANAAIKVVDDAIKMVSAERSKMGAYQNRLEHSINNLNTSSENLTAAESRIRDVDMAKEMMNQTKNSILSQAAQAMLAQSNQMPQGVLQLLR
ncbi:flagellin [Bacillus rubiinfantis]|uniref:flagellin N-terminal helical domain-containing protein n=1 Tax=Bacillus rubiinfantis TaxID=1499680 RepID=UPI0005A70E6A|nr:flagellin [Bacillus rubiinfantis]